MQTLIEVLCAVDRAESILTWKRNQQVLELLGEIASGVILLTHDGLAAAGSGRHVDHLRSLLQHHGLLPERDEHLDRFEVWLVAGLCRLRSESQPGKGADGSKRSARQEITETIKFLTRLEDNHDRTALSGRDGVWAGARAMHCRCHRAGN
jgi:hypothetical protein